MERQTSDDLTQSQTLLMTSSTFEEMASALSAYSRAPTPDPLCLACCCRREVDECEHCEAWLSLRGKLEERLFLAARVGQALLEKHEAYVRMQNEKMQAMVPSEDLTNEVNSLKSENKSLLKSLTEAHSQSTLTEHAHKSTLSTLHSLQSSHTRLQTLHARSTGWETRLASLESQNEDLRQELEYARKAEVRVGVLEGRVEKLRGENERLREESEVERVREKEGRERGVRDARARLEGMLASMPHSPTTSATNDDISAILEELVAENEALKRANAESANLLSEAREELSQSQRIERSAQPTEPWTRGHNTSTSITSFASSSHDYRRNRSHNGSTSPSALGPHTFAHTPEPENRPPLVSPRPLHPFMLEVPHVDSAGSEYDHEQGKPRSPMRTLMLLTRERGVQTSPPLTPNPPYAQFVDIHSNTNTGSFPSRPSSRTALSDPDTNTNTSITHLLTTLQSLLLKLQSADIHTTSARLKRQHLSHTREGVLHICTGTIQGVLASARSLGIGIGGGRVDMGVGMTMTREEWRGLVGWCRKCLGEVAVLRTRINEMEGGEKEKEKKAEGWMAPLSKFFSDGGSGSAAVPPRTKTPIPMRPPPAPLPKLTPSTTTVNVEFTAAGMGVRHRDRTPAPVANEERQAGMSKQEKDPGKPPQLMRSSPSVRAIFAGSRMSSAPGPSGDWVVLPGTRRVSKTFGSGAGLGGVERRMSRNLDAILDEPNALGDGDGDEKEPEQVAPFRTLRSRPRGLSDSSIHTTFMSHDPDASLSGAPSGRQGAAFPAPIPVRASVLHNLSQRVQSFASSVTYAGAGSSLSGSPGTHQHQQWGPGRVDVAKDL